jgi:flagellar biosynthesis protein FliQ
MVLMLFLLPGTPIDRALWVLWIVMFAVLEGLGIARKWGTTSLTDLTLSIVPKWLLAMALGWLAYHFLIQYSLK